MGSAWAEVLGSDGRVVSQRPVVQLVSAVDDQQGPDVAQRAVVQVAADIGGQMEQECRV